MIRSIRQVISCQRNGNNTCRFMGSTAAAVKDKFRDYLKVNDSDGVREIILNHQKSRNALSLSMMDGLHCAIKEKLDDLNLRCIILSGNGKIWSAGHDLRELMSKPDEQKAAFWKLADIILSIRNAPVPVVAKVNGHAVAAGCQLAASCDLLVCTKSSKFSTPGVNLGIFCSTPGIAISRVMPSPKSAYMLMTGLPISGEEAYIAGLATKAVEETELDATLDEITNAIKLKSRAVIAYGKEFYYKQRDLKLEDAYKQGCDKMCTNLALPDCKEGVSSFFEKRTPNWRHE